MSGQNLVRTNLHKKMKSLRSLYWIQGLRQWYEGVGHATCLLLLVAHDKTHATHLLFLHLVALFSFMCLHSQAYFLYMCPSQPWPIFSQLKRPHGERLQPHCGASWWRLGQVDCEDHPLRCWLAKPRGHACP